MVFSSLIFTFFFLPVVLILYYLAKDKYRNYILLIASLYFYSYGEPQFVFVMVGSILCNYLMALLVDKFKGKSLARVFMAIAAVLNIGILFIYKYLDFAIDISNNLFRSQFKAVGIVLPIGISFFTFQALSYVIDVYRGVVKVQKNPLFVALYISFFPQLIAGPIVRYSTIEEQIGHREHTVELFADGARRFMLGFCKKVILANNLALVAQGAFSCDVKEANILYLWLGSICFSLQIFYDFSGYSDMAIGLGKIFGFKFEENFNYPYISKSVTEFWRRWHISLSQWFRDYVYIPLGGSRVSWGRHIFNMFVVWMFTGIWHGANYTFIAWGLGYFILLVVEKLIVKPSEKKNIVFRIFWQIFTLLCVNFGWVIFNSPDLLSGIRYCLGMLGRYERSISIDSEIIYNLHQYGVFIVLGILFSTPIMKCIKEKLSGIQASYIFEWIEPIGYGLIFIWGVSFLILGAHNPFIYFNF
ncbi:alginate O-acetyltransferase complex protein AlgI [Butyrivibrio sp. ob235]|uniref:MBOAT family O-acyltransferase n=1 Tax=Butyrivibrio sp. ob235 TaxID=1761780 RepID=UPI0008C430A1|nr:MBOAT family O-acyltransferase [Butyrivibrio sp. ob235]SEM26145.1 alginate O-acetyltransferase complex protein AlgI [Butyrivibrio sp. ob235]